MEIRTGTLAVGMDERSVTVKGPDGEETIRTRTRIWAAGRRRLAAGDDARRGAAARRPTAPAGSR